MQKSRHEKKLNVNSAIKLNTRPSVLPHAPLFVFCKARKLLTRRKNFQKLKNKFNGNEHKTLKHELAPRRRGSKPKWEGKLSQLRHQNLLVNRKIMEMYRDSENKARGKRVNKKKFAKIDKNKNQK